MGKEAGALVLDGSISILQLTLEFYERKKTSWLFPAEITNWEVWHIHLSVFDPSSEEGILCMCLFFL